MFRSLTEDEASQIERWQAPRIGEPARVAEGLKVPLHEIDIQATASLLSRDESDVAVSVANSSPPSALMIQHAYDEGFEKGLMDAERQASEKAVMLLEPLVKALASEVSVSELACSDELILLARAMAALILHREIREDPAVLTGFVDQAISALDIKDEAIEVRLNTADLALISEAGLADPTLTWKSDANLPRGSCVVESGASRIRNGIEAQLERMVVDLDLASPAPDAQDLEAA